MKKIRRATDNLSNVFARGMFSTVYYGTLEDGTRVAIKSDQKALYNPHNLGDFQKKIQVLQNLDHPNLVMLYGYLEDGENSIFVTEYVKNGNLRQHLDGEFEKPLGFRRRLDISIEVANAVAYLHANPDYPIIHGRLKSSNVLLTNSLKAMVSDFGFPPQSGGDVSTSYVIPVVYCDPEYLQTYRFTEKSDVFSFGVVLIELLTGRPPLMTNRDADDYVTSKWVKDMFEQGKGIDTLDPQLPRVSGTIFVAEQILALAVLCLNRKGKNRPTMSHCANLLTQIREEYSELLFGS
ncbi:Protein kinase family protein [Rhynchospora pubera]|uniref:non-specific serine/threonine protein kinase n=1 Tax=Rhynchospora pubera TaxID=906938 RepID=A0AAV8F557_9POAL|nr:Protein kinase family protein [Rhynchospora pubera]